MIEINSFVSTYGYWAILLGTLFEGETILLAAGYAAQRGLLDWPIVVAVACVGGTLGDQAAFLLGRWKGVFLLTHFPSLARRVPRMHRLLERYHVLLIPSIRFIYGLRIAGPVIMGTTKVPFLRFAILNLLGAVLWAFVVTGAGYYFGAILETLITDVKRIEHWILLGMLAGGLLVGLWLHRRATRLDR